MQMIISAMKNKGKIALFLVFAVCILLCVFGDAGLFRKDCDEPAKGHKTPELDVVATIDVVEYVNAYIRDLRNTGGGDEYCTYLHPINGSPIIKIGFDKSKCAKEAENANVLKIIGDDVFTLMTDTTYLTEYQDSNGNFRTQKTRLTVDVSASLSVLSLTPEFRKITINGKEYIQRKFTIEYTFSFTHSDPVVGAGEIMYSPIYHKSFVYTKTYPYKELSVAPLRTTIATVAETSRVNASSYNKESVKRQI